MQFFKSYLSEYDPGLTKLSEEAQLKIREDMLVEVNRWAYFLCLLLFLNLLFDLYLYYLAGFVCGSQVLVFFICFKNCHLQPMSSSWTQLFVILSWLTIKNKDIPFLGLHLTVQRHLEIEQPFGACPRLTLTSRKRHKIGVWASRQSHGFHNVWNKSLFCCRFALASHFFWGLWSIIQARLSTIEFGYLVSFCNYVYVKVHAQSFRQ